MKKVILSILAVLMAVPAIMAKDELPPRQETLKTLIKVNDLYMRKHPDPLLGIPYYSRKKV